jgi:threonine/homoserine/homoserine lactone efflux protein
VPKSIKPALLYRGILMLVSLRGYFFCLRKEKINNCEIDKEQKNYLSLFIKGFLLNVINIGVLGFWMAVIISAGPNGKWKT